MPTLPPIVPERTTAGIALDPKTLERVVPQTKRTDGRYVAHILMLHIIANIGYFRLCISPNSDPVLPVSSSGPHVPKHSSLWLRRRVHLPLDIAAINILAISRYFTETFNTSLATSRSPNTPSVNSVYVKS